MIKFSTQKVIEVQDWDQLVEETYGKPYSFQQQDGCKPRGIHHLSVPADDWEYENDTVPDVINGDEMGVSFKAWLSREITEWNGEEDIGDKSWRLKLFWARNFYPSVDAIANDLHQRGLLPEGEYIINIDW